MEKRTKFFYPTAKISSETHAVLPFHHDETKDIYDKLHEKEMESILQHSVKENNIFEQRMIEYIMSQITFSTNSFDDKQFNVLTLTKEAFSKITPHICFELGAEYFTIYNPVNKKSLSFEYNENLKPILECLETEEMTLAFYSVMLNLDCKPMIDGLVLCNIIDFRFEQQIERTCLFKCGHEILENFITTTDNPDEIEQQTLLTLNPDICTDPSPDVARVMSIIDNRSKMWIKDHPPNKEPDFIPPPKQETKVVEKHYAPIDVARQVAIPESLQAAFSRLGSLQSLLNKVAATKVDDNERRALHRPYMIE